MAERRIDLGFTRPLPDTVGGLPLHQEKIFDDELCVALPKGHPLAEDDAPLPLRKLAREGLVLMGRKEAPWLYDTVIAVCRKAGFSPRVAAAPDYQTTALMLVEAEVGVGIVPSSTSRYQRHLPIVFRRLQAGDARLPLLMVWPRGDVPPTVSLFCDLVRERREQIVRAVRL
jgi:DNA-binding transcriptional LysR family regulator